MKRAKELPLTETTYYILMALLEPGHGYLIMQKVEEMSLGDVKIAAGTMYGAIENLLKLEWITSVPTDDKRRKVYQTTVKGREILKLEIERFKKLLMVAEDEMMKGEHDAEM
ncbi:PadR family transcriptional regulator [Streptococcus pluranimalium]